MKEHELLVKDEAIASAAIPICFADLEGKIAYANPAFLGMWGYEDEQEILGLSTEAFGSSSQQVKRIMQAIAIDGSWEGNDLAKKKDGTPFEVFITASLVKNEEGKPLYMLATFTDVTQQKANERQLVEHSENLEKEVAKRTLQLSESESKLQLALKKEKELSQLKSQFVSMASHEFRTPLAAILSSTNLIEKYNTLGELEKQKKHIARIKSSVENLTSILNDFLSLEKLESGKVTNNPKTANLLEFVQDVQEALQPIKGTDQHIHHSHTGSESIQIDEHLFKNILLNLLSNALKYSPQGEDVLLTTENTCEFLKVQVKDQGIGIPEADQEQMFSRFFRATNAKNIKGTGLGLTIVKRYLDLLGGKISFMSQVNLGTTFELVIPHSQMAVSGI